MGEQSADAAVLAAEADGSGAFSAAASAAAAAATAARATAKEARTAAKAAASEAKAAAKRARHGGAAAEDEDNIHGRCQVLLRRITLAELVRRIVAHVDITVKGGGDAIGGNIIMRGPDAARGEDMGIGR